MGDASLPRACRITKTDDYRQVYRNGRKVPSQSFLLFIRISPTGISRIGISSGKKVGNAVVRNLVKRRMREVLRRCRPRFAFPADVVLVAHPRAADLSFPNLEKEIIRMLSAARLLT